MLLHRSHSTASSTSANVLNSKPIFNSTTFSKQTKILFNDNGSFLSEFCFFLPCKIPSLSIGHVLNNTTGQDLSVCHGCTDINIIRLLLWLFWSMALCFFLWLFWISDALVLAVWLFWTSCGHFGHGPFGLSQFWLFPVLKQHRWQIHQWSVVEYLSTPLKIQTWAKCNECIHLHRTIRIRPIRT